MEQGHSALGAVLVREGQLAAGIRELEKALSLNPNDRSAQLNLAMVYSETGDSGKGNPVFRKTESRSSNRAASPGRCGCWRRMRGLSPQRGQATAAITEMRQAVSAERDNAELHDELGTLYAQQRDWRAA